MKKRMLIMLICVAVLFGGIFIYKFAMGILIQHFMAANQNPTVTISATKVGYSAWQPKLKASGSVRAIRGVNVTTELAGMVQKIYFTPGAMVKKDMVLVQLNADTDIAQLHSLEANAATAKITYERDKAQYEAQAISKATLDTDLGNLKNTVALVASQAATVKKKTLRAPFTGRLGISAVNPGQYINPGDKVVALQQLDPIYIDFFVPQQELPKLKTGQPVEVTVAGIAKQIFRGKITTIDPVFDNTTRNVEVEATLPNPKNQLVPGMFATVEVITGAAQQHLTLPHTAISFNPYGEIVFRVRETGKDKDGKPILTATQAFVTTGEERGDQVTILTGLKKDDWVVTSGQVKLKNGSMVAINNKVVPSDNPAPHTNDE